MLKELNILLVANGEKGAYIKDGIKSIKSIATRVKTCALQEGWELIVSHKPNVLICVAEEAYADNMALIKKCKEYYHGITVILISDNKDSEYILEAYKTGIKDFLKSPCDLEELKKSLSDLYEEVTDIKRTGANGKIVSVFSNKGGIGVTTVATNLACSLAQLKDARVLLCDFVLHHGDIAIFLDTEIKYTINEIVANMNRIDKTFLENSLSRTPSGLFVLHSPENPEDSDYINTSHLLELIQQLKKYFDFIIVDTAHDYNDNNISIFDNSDVILELLTLELPCICNCGKTLEVFQKLRYERDKVKLIVNRTNAKNQIGVKIVEEQLNYPIFYQLPNDYPTVVKAINSGKSIFDVSKTSTISTAINGLRDTLLTDLHKSYAEDKEGFFKKMFRK